MTAFTWVFTSDKGEGFCDVTVYATVYICERLCRISGKVVEGSRQNFCTSIATGHGKRKRPVYLAEPKGCSSSCHRQWVDKPLLFVTHGQRNARSSQPQCITRTKLYFIAPFVRNIGANVLKHLFILQYVDAQTCQSIDRWSAGIDDSPVGVPDEQHQQRERDDDWVRGAKRRVADDEQQTSWRRRRRGARLRLLRRLLLLMMMPTILTYTVRQ